MRREYGEWKKQKELKSKQWQEDKRNSSKNKYMKITDWNMEQGDWQREKKKDR